MANKTTQTPPTNKPQKNTSNGILLPALLFTGLAVYGIKELVLPYLLQTKEHMPRSIESNTGSTDTSIPQVIEKTVIVDHSDSDNTPPPPPPPPPPPDDDGHHTTTKHKAQPQPQPIPPSPDPKKTAASKGNPVAGILGNLFTDLIDHISPPENQQFFYSEQDVINNERIFLRHLKNTNKGLCKAYTQWPAIKMKEEKTAKLYY